MSDITYRIDLITSQMSFSDVEFGTMRKQTRREKFLPKMNAVIPWIRLVQLIVTVYLIGKYGRPSYVLETTLRIHFMPQRFGLSDPAMEESLYTIQSMRRQLAVQLLAEGNAMLAILYT